MLDTLSHDLISVFSPMAAMVGKPSALCMHGMPTIDMSFQIVFTGSLRGGFNRHRGVESLRNQFSLDETQVKRLLSGSRRVVKRVDDRRHAEKIVKALWRSGWHSELYLKDRVVFRTGEVKSERQGTQRESHVRLVRQYSEDFTVSVCLPESWRKLGNLNAEAVMQAGDPDAHHYMVVLKQARSGLPAGLSLWEYSAAQLRQCVGKVVSGVLVSEPAAQKHSDLPIYVAEMSGKLSDVFIHYLVANLQCSRSFYTIFLWCDQAVYASQQQLFHSIVGSFRTRSIE